MSGSKRRTAATPVQQGVLGVRKSESGDGHRQDRPVLHRVAAEHVARLHPAGPARMMPAGVRSAIVDMHLATVAVRHDDVGCNRSRQAAAQLRRHRLPVAPSDAMISSMATSSMTSQCGTSAEYPGCAGQARALCQVHVLASTGPVPN